MAQNYTVDSPPQKRYKLAVYIGRMQPPHAGHYRTIEKALEHADNILIILGSCFQPPTIKNPFSFDQRKQMLLSQPPEISARISNIVPMRDYTYNNGRWMKEVNSVITSQCDNRFEVLMVGHRKDKSSSYLDWFPQYDNFDVGSQGVLNATDIRNDIWEEGLCSAYLCDDEPQWKDLGYSALGVESLFVEITKHGADPSPLLKRLQTEYQFYKRYKEAWKDAPFTPIFVTVDSVVIKQGHVLLVRRGAHPGKGLLALPGGFLNPDEELIDGAIRELVEETSINLPVSRLKNCVKSSKEFAHPGRSLRGRTITHAFLIKLEDHGPLPKVKGADDAVEAMWIPVSSANLSEYMFEDHYSIIEYMYALADTK